MPPTAGQVRPLFDLPGDLNEAELLTVNVLSSRNIGATNGDFRLRVLAGAGPVTNVFTCDLGEGCQFSIVAQSLRLELVSFQPYLGSPFGNPGYDPANGQAEVTAQVVRGGFGRGVPLTYSEPAFRMTPATSRVYPIPAFARRVFVASNADTADAAVASWVLRSPSNSNFGGFLNRFYEGNFQPIPAGMDHLRIDTNAAANDIDMQPIWELAF